MTGHLIQCLFKFMIILLLLFVTLVPLNSEQASEESVENIEIEQFYEDIDKSDWVDHGDMFTFDPVTKTNREPRLKEMAADLMKRVRERRKINGEVQHQDSYSPDCIEVSTQLRNCELAQKQSRCDCSGNDLCGKRSYQIIRRLVLLLDKQLKKKYSRGSILELKVNLDDILFEMPENINNSTDCDYLAHFHPLMDQLLSLISVYQTEPLPKAEYLSFKTIGTSIGSLVISLAWIKMSTRYKLVSLFVLFCIIVVIWEWLLLYHTESAAIEAKLNRLKDKCESEAKPNWFGWIYDMLPDVVFNNRVSECTDYYISTRVHPLLTVNPVKALSKVFEATFLYAFKLMADSAGASFRIFFSHIPWFWTLPVMIGIFFCIYSMIRYCLKYRYKYKPIPRKPRPTKTWKSLGQGEGIARLEHHPVRQRIAHNRLQQSDKKTKKLTIDVPLARYGSTGDIQKLF